MPITRESLESRLTQLKSQLEQCRQQFALLTGAVQVTEQLLDEEATPAPEKDKEV